MEQLALFGSHLGYIGASVALGLIVLGASLGIGMISGKALDAASRQPELKNDMRTMMILGAALIEGVAFFAAVVCLIIVLTK